MSSILIVLVLADLGAVRFQARAIFSDSTHDHCTPLPQRAGCVSAPTARPRPSIANGSKRFGLITGFAALHVYIHRAKPVT